MRQTAEIIPKIVYDFDTILLQETHLKEAEKITCPGYICNKSPIGQTTVSCGGCPRCSDFGLSCRVGFVAVGPDWLG